MLNFTPDTDGLDHINIYSKGKTQLGRSLSNFAYFPIEHPKHGKFSSIEAFWYWYFSGQQHNALRNLWGYRAKLEGGHKLTQSYSIGENDKVEILDAIRIKIMSYDELKQDLKTSILPLAHYYAYGGQAPYKIYYLQKYYWLVEGIENIRKELQS